MFGSWALVLLLGLTAAADQPASIEGEWVNSSGSVIVKIQQCGSALCGTVAWASETATRDAARAGTTPLVGTEVLSELVPAGPGVWRGSLFVPDLRRRGSARLRQRGTEHLELVGCQLGGLICKRQIWVSAKDRSIPPGGSASSGRNPP